MKPKILITGASGFIGSHLVDAAILQGFEVWAGIRTTSSTEFLKHPDLHVITLDFSSPSRLMECFREISTESNGWDFVIHNAGITQAKRKMDFHTVNCLYTRNLVEALTSSGMPLKKLVFISSLAAFGPGDPTSMLPIQVTNPQRPVSAYAESKRLAEEYLRSLKSFPWLIINPTAVYGPRDRDFLEFVKLLRRGWELYIGSNKQLLSMIYAPDLADAVVRLLNYPVAHRSIIVSDGKAYEKEQLGQIVREALGRRTIQIRVPLGLLRWSILAVEKMYSLFGTLPFLTMEKLDEISQANWLCDSGEVWRLLSKSPSHDLQTGMKETVNWYRKQGWI